MLSEKLNVVTSRPFDQINISKGGLQLVNRKKLSNNVLNNQTKVNIKFNVRNEE